MVGLQVRHDVFQQDRPAFGDLAATITAGVYIASCLGGRPHGHFGHVFERPAVSPEDAIA
jgi:hypothetical protein